MLTGVSKASRVQVPITAGYKRPIAVFRNEQACAFSMAASEIPELVSKIEIQHTWMILRCSLVIIIPSRNY